MRTANLLGKTGEERKAIDRDVRGFYDLRSKVIHGKNLREKHRPLLAGAHRLRDLVRRAFLSTLALSKVPGLDAELCQKLDATALDDALCGEIQAIASPLLALAR